MTGLLGGAFDPPHYGHLALADGAISRLGLERLLVIPTGVAPHKDIRTDAETRCRLAGAAFAGRRRVQLSRWELDRGTPSYTIETARWAAERYGEIAFIVGADQFASLPSWKDPAEVLEVARLGVGTRPGYPRAQLEQVLEELPDPTRVIFFEIEPLEISSTDIRERVARGESIDGLVPPAVAALIECLGLYGEA